MHIKTYIKEFSTIPQRQRQRISGMFASLKAHRISQKKFRKFEKDHYLFSDQNFPQTRTSVNSSTLKMTHVQTHRPMIKSRVIKTKQQASFSINKQDKLRIRLENKFKTIVNPANQSHFLYGRQERFKSTHSSNKNGFKKRQANNSQLPQYAKNIMKPCQITSIFLKTRPLTCSKMMRNPQIQIQDQAQIYRNNLTSQRNRQKQHKQHRYSKSVRQTVRQNKQRLLIKLQPWQNQNQDQFNIF